MVTRMLKASADLPRETLVKSIASYKASATFKFSTRLLTRSLGSRILASLGNGFELSRYSITDLSPYHPDSRSLEIGWIYVWSGEVHVSLSLQFV